MAYTISQYMTKAGKRYEPFALGFPIVVIPQFSQCFQRFPHGPQFTPIHSKSRHFSIKRGQNVGTDGRGSPDHRQVEALACPQFHGTVLLVVAKQQ